MEVGPEHVEVVLHARLSHGRDGRGPPGRGRSRDAPQGRLDALLAVPAVDGRLVRHGPGGLPGLLAQQQQILRGVRGCSARESMCTGPRERAWSLSAAMCRRRW